MTMEFMFAIVPFNRDGDLDDLHHEVPECGDFTEYLKEGVQILETEGEESIPSQFGLSLNISGGEDINRKTEGAFLELLNGDMNQRYVLLARRKKALNQLRAAIPKMSTEFLRKFLEVFIHNADAALKRYGEKAAIIIL